MFVIVKFAFLHCRNLPHLFIVKFAVLQRSCIALEDFYKQ